MKRIFISICLLFSLYYSAKCQGIKIQNETFDNLKTYQFGTYIGDDEFLNIREDRMPYIQGYFKDIYFNKSDSILSLNGSLYEGQNEFNEPLKYFVILSGIFIIDTSFKNENQIKTENDSTKIKEVSKNTRGVENIVSKTPGILTPDKFIPSTIFHFENTKEFKVKIKIKSVNDILCFASEVEFVKDNEHDSDKTDTKSISFRNHTLFYKIGEFLK